MAATLRLSIKRPHQKAARRRPNQTSRKRQLRPRVIRQPSQQLVNDIIINEHDIPASKQHQILSRCGIINDQKRQPRDIIDKQR